jgi:hypothetical protein
MNPIWKKLQYKDQDYVSVLNAPASAEQIFREPPKGTQVSFGPAMRLSTPFLVAFATTKSELAQYAKLAKRLGPSGVVWVAYPKKSSKEFACEFDRDNGWSDWGAAGFEPVRQIALDGDWTALRFKQVEQIKTLTRKSAISADGKTRVIAAAARTKVKRTSLKKAKPRKKSSRPPKDPERAKPAPR